MTLVVEDGTGLANSEAYISVADADTYISDRGGDTLWDAATTAAKEQALRLATEYLDAEYRFKGHPYLSTQALKWPRYPVYIDGVLLDDYTIPEELKRANVELAKLHVNGTTLYNETLTNPGTLTEVTAVVGELRSTKKYTAGSQRKYFPRVSSLVRDITYARRAEKA